MAGYTTNYTVAVWAGYDNASGEQMEYLGESSQRIPKYIFKNLMEHMAQSKETKDFDQPDSVVKVESSKVRIQLLRPMNIRQAVKSLMNIMLKVTSLHK
ncbi:hypothetical protein KEH51_22910 [[Brevibacterium] frigoritolerans]|uniref:Penicillin-binding protein transpeptidase domain-containing protein n=2 Tax=Peribacillus frigoritolerans TaxID=450367 RepID=A0A941FLQ3_9BACI|nr:hypothetical protein [Peribacillus frigoritolerans]